MSKRYEIKSTAIYLGGGIRVLIEVKSKVTTRQLLMNEDDLFIPLDGKLISDSLLDALVKEYASSDFDKSLLLNVNKSRTASKFEIEWANDIVSKKNDWWYNPIGF